MIIPSPFFSPQAFGASGDGQTSDTRALQAAIDACGGRQGGGGTVYLPAGRYRSGALFFHDNVTLHLDAGATLLGSQDPAEYPVAGNRWEGTEQPTYTPLLAGNGLKNITITGRGVIDGQGDFWWRAHRDKTLPYPRPRLIGFTDCHNVLIEGVTLKNSPAWTINPVRCENVNIRGVTIINPPESPNTDGINPDSCRLVRISDCFVSVGDDCITIKAGTQFESPEHLRPCRDITITNCTLERGHGGVVIGSETSGSIQNIAVSNCVFIGTDRGIRMKSRRGRGGVVENVRVTNIIMDGVLCPFTMNLLYHCGARGDPLVADTSRRPVDAGTPRFRGIHFSHISAVGVKIAAGFLYGLPEMPVEDISFNDISIEMTGGADPATPEMADNFPRMAQAGLYVRNARDLRLRDVRIRGQAGKAFDFDESVIMQSEHVCEAKQEPFDEEGDER
jgi:polygalacturonase